MCARSDDLDAGTYTPTFDAATTRSPIFVMNHTNFVRIVGKGPATVIKEVAHANLDGTPYAHAVLVPLGCTLGSRVVTSENHTGLFRG